MYLGKNMYLGRNMYLGGNMYLGVQNVTIKELKNSNNECINNTDKGITSGRIMHS